jgi:hypothetical protein
MGYDHPPLVVYLQKIGFEMFLAGSPHFKDQCHSVAYVESAQKLELGICRILWRKWDDTPTFIIYDTSGQILVRPEYRSEQWQLEMARLPRGRVIKNYLFPGTVALGHAFYGFSVNPDI